MNADLFWETDRTPGGYPVMVVVDAHSHRLNDVTVSDGDTVLLHLGDERILVTDVRAVGNKRYRGRIQSFQTSMLHTFEGRTCGDEVEFNYDQAFSVTHY